MSPRLGERTIQAAVSDGQQADRRFYVRAVFALIEAVVEQHRRLLLDWAERGAVAFPEGVREVLSERIFVARENGNVHKRTQYLSLRNKLRVVYKTAAPKAFLQPLSIEFADEGWRAFCAALEVRDQITHPKTFVDCHVDKEELETVETGRDWYGQVNKEFVRVATEHQHDHSWGE